MDPRDQGSGAGGRSWVRHYGPLLGTLLPNEREIQSTQDRRHRRGGRKNGSLVFEKRRSIWAIGAFRDLIGFKTFAWVFFATVMCGKMRWRPGLGSDTHRTGLHCFGVSRLIFQHLTSHLTSFASAAQPSLFPFSSSSARLRPKFIRHTERQRKGQQIDPQH